MSHLHEAVGGFVFDFEPFRTASGPSSRERPSYNAGGRCIAEKPPVGLGWDKSEIKPARVQSAISSLKNAGFDATSYAEITKHGHGDRIVSRVFDLYEKTLQQRNAVDFDDMLSLTARLLEHSPETRAKYAVSYTHLTLPTKRIV